MFRINYTNEFLRNLSKKENLRILGNGSSLNAQLNELDVTQYDYLVVNRHILSASYTSIKPRYYVLADPHFFFHSEGKDILEKIKVQTQWEMTLFVPYSRKVKKISNLFKENKKINLHFYNYFDFKGFSSVKLFLEKKNLAMPKAQNVLVAAIYLGICARYKSIELYGVEHSWLRSLSVDESNDVCLENPHFFDKEKVQVKKWRDIQHSEAKLHEVLRMYAFMFESYWELKKLAEKLNVKIFNMTQGSFIDAFERK